MKNKVEDLKKAVWKAANKTINKFRENPYYFFTESDIHSYFYYALYSSHFEESTEDINRIYCVHREYPTNFRYKKQDLLNDAINRPDDLDGNVGSRGHYDIAVLNPEFIKKVNSEKDIINKDISLVIKREKNNKKFNDIKELLFAIEFKYIINNSKKFVNEVKMDNKKLLFAKEYGGAEEVVNLVFCNTKYHYINDLQKEISTASDKILSIFIQSYFDGKKKDTPRPLMNKEDSRIK